MFAFLRRAFWILLGFVLIVAIVWFAGPYFAFANYYPLEPEIARLVVIGLIVGIWLLSRLIKRLRAFRASDRLLAAVVAQPQPEAAKTPAELVKLRERFEEAVSTLKQQRRTGHSLYDLPWYIIIGAPGSGKTTALLNSGLKFPLEQRVGKGALRGVGGTRNCDWWFADEAIFLDTAGRYTTQDSDAASDAAGWREFLALLKKYRVRRPVNGVILTINAEDLIVQGEAARQAHVDAARSRLEELSRELGIQLPVYVMVTKCDLVDGFAEYFDDLSAAGRSQVWGVTFPYEQSLANEGPQVFPADFDALMTRLNEKVFERVEQVREPRRRTKVFAFPQQLAATRDALTQFVTDVFAGRGDGRIMLRGVYFTSGTQYGTPIDRLLGSIGQRFGTSEAVLASAGPGKAYFVEQLLKDVMIGESGLAGINRRLEARKAAGQLAAYAAMGLVAIAGVALLTVSYRRNREYFETTATEVARLDQLGPMPSDAPVEQILPRLDAVKTIVDSADRYRTANTWAMRWGLYQGRSIYNAAQGAYMRELDSLLLPRVASQIQRRLVQSHSQPEAVFLYLKGYLMLSDPKHLDKDYIQELADLEWRPGQSATGQALSDHLKNLLQNPESLRSFGVDGALVNQARASIPQSSWPRILYDEVKRASAARKDGDLRIDEQVGLEVEQVFRRRSGVLLSTPMPRLYTPDVFKQITGPGRLDLVTEVTKDGWVWGQDKLSSISNARNVVSGVTSLYEQDYSDQWDHLLDDLELVPFRTIPQANNALRVLTSQTSPLRGLVRVVATNTRLVEQKPAAQPGAVEQAEKKVFGTLGDVLKPLQGVTGTVLPPDPAMPGRAVTAHFDAFRQLTVGEENKTQLDAVIQAISEIQQQLDTLGPGVTDADVAQILSKPEFRALLTLLRRQADDLPRGVRTVATQVADSAKTLVNIGATREIEARYQNVVRVCDATIADRYPFVNSRQDVQLTDFATVFGYDGVYDAFFKKELASQVDTSTTPWTWREGAITPASGMLDTLQAAQRVRAMFFPEGSKTPSLSFTVMVTDLDAAATRFVLEIDGQVIDATHQPLVKKPAVWPGAVSHNAATSFEARYYDPTERYGGPWAWFRLIDETREGDPDQDQSIRLNIHDRYHQAHITVETTKSYNNPFANSSWRQFTCGS